MMVTCHSNKLTSSTSPAENPSTGRLVSSAPSSATCEGLQGPRGAFHPQPRVAPPSTHGFEQGSHL